MAMKLIVCLSVIVGAVGSEEYKMVTSIQPLEAKWWHESTSGECYGVDTGKAKTSMCRLGYCAWSKLETRKKMGRCPHRRHDPAPGPRVPAPGKERGCVELQLFHRHMSEDVNEVHLYWHGRYGDEWSKDPGYNEKDVFMWSLKPGAMNTVYTNPGHVWRIAPKYDLKKTWLTFRIPDHPDEYQFHHFTFDADSVAAYWAHRTEESRRKDFPIKHMAHKHIEGFYANEKL